MSLTKPENGNLSKNERFQSSQENSTSQGLTITLTNLILILVTATATNEQTDTLDSSAFETFKKLSKIAELRIDITPSMEVKPLGNEWFVEYIKNPQTNITEPLIRSVVILTQGSS